ncbi:MAG: phosphate ABC transporter substrate-binding/OmpA family protein [Pseudomonadota bacterium]
MHTKQFSSGKRILSSLLLSAAIVLPSVGQAEEITLLSQDGTINIKGEFVSFEENIYLVRTALGELRLSAERVRCEGAACPVFEPVEADVVLAGSDTVGTGVVPLMLEGYAGFLEAESTLSTTDKENEVLANFVGDFGFGDPLGVYRVSSENSASAFSSLLKGEAQIGMSSRRIRPDEARALRDAGAGNMISPDQEHIVAIDSIVVITHPDNPVRSVSMEDLAKIYAGTITNWSQVGGPDLAIKVIDRDGGGTRRTFLDRLMPDNANVTSVASVAVDNNEMAQLVTEEPGAIGYTGYAFQRGAKPLTLINECGIGMAPDPFSARTEEYALQRRLYLYNRADGVDQATQSFIDYARSANADDVIVKAGFIDLGVDRRAQPSDGERAKQLTGQNVDAFEAGYMQQMLGLMENHDRLSTTFRFRTGSSKLDERAVIDMERLTTYLEEQGPDTKIKLVGFTDSVGAFQSNQVLAEGRAAQVMEELAAYAGDRLAGVEMSTAAFGEIAPSACNASDSGRAINRRVEVWIQAAG